MMFTQPRSFAFQSILKACRAHAPLCLVMLASAGLCHAAPKKKASSAEAPAPVSSEPATAPAIELGAPFGDHAILQRGIAVPVWGWSKPGTAVTVAFAGQSKSASAAEDGKWIVRLDAMEASAEPREMTIREATGASAVLKDILVGEVWVASGQSNMQWLAGNSTAKLLVKELDAEAEANGGVKPPIREFGVSNYFSSLHPIEHAAGSWKAGDYKDYSAIALAFAHQLYKELGVPIGILNCSFSQTRIEAWTPRGGFSSSKSEYIQGIERQLLETDPSTPEHRKAWDAYYQSVMAAVANNRELAAQGDENFISIPALPVPGNMQGNRDSTWMYNARMNPVVPYGVSGVIWNQGYANRSGGINYYDNLHCLVKGLRERWDNPTMPVYFHQFYTPGGRVGVPSIDSTAEMRLGTWLARDIPHTGMASQIDITGAIHYVNKVVPGQRLALHALKHPYGKDVVADGPMYQDYKVDGSRVVLEFEHADGGLLVADAGANARAGFAIPKPIENGEKQVNLFYLCGEDRYWHPAQYKIDGQRVLLSAEGVKAPRGISYGAAGIGFQPNLYNHALLPMTPFIVYDHELVTSANWPEPVMRVAGVEDRDSRDSLLYEYRKAPVLSTQFRDHAVLRAGKPITFWGSAVHDDGYEAKGKAVIHFSFDGIEKTIPVTPGMKQWQVVVPAMEASDKPKALKVSLTIDGELAHERVAEDILIGDVWYVAGLAEPGLAKEVSGPVRVMACMSKRATSSAPRPYTVANSGTPLNRFASFWGSPKGGGFADSLAKALHAKTGRPIGLIYMNADDLELKQWMTPASLAEAPSTLADYNEIAAITPGTTAYEQNATRYIDAWKHYWGDYVPKLIATRAVPDQSAWGHFPSFGGKIETNACQGFNVLLASFATTALKGLVFIPSQLMVSGDKAANYGPELSAMATGWKRHFGADKATPFIYAIPAASIAPGITKPAAIEGANTAVELSRWPKKNAKGKVDRKDTEYLQGVIEAVVKQAN